MPNQPDEALYVLLAFLLGVGVAAIPIRIIVQQMWLLVKVEAIDEKPIFAMSTHDALRRYQWQGDIVGIVERLLYVTALILGRPEFIAVWLTLKTVARARRWTEEGAVRGRAIFNNFLVGNGLSIFCSVAAVAIAQLAAGPLWPPDPLLALYIFLALIVLSAVGSLLLRYKLKEAIKRHRRFLSDDEFKYIWGKPRLPGSDGSPA